MFATTSTRPRMETSFVMMALRNAGRDAIQSRVSAPFKQMTTKSVMEVGFRLPNTDAEVCQHMRTPMQRHNRCIGTSSIKNFCQDCRLQGTTGAESAQHRHKNTSKRGPFPCPHQHPNLSAAFLKFNAAVPMRLYPTKHARKDAGIHPVQDD